MTQNLQLQEQHADSNCDKPSPDARSRLQQLRIIKGAYGRLTPTEPQLPSPNSPIPALLALRSTHRLALETNESLHSTRSDLKEARRDLAREKEELSNAALLTEALENRISQLREAVSRKSEQSVDEVIREISVNETERKASYEESTKLLTRSLVKFIDSDLAPLLAAEELGGPVAGSSLDITEEMLAAGFGPRGKGKKTKEATEDKRQRRIDEIWGSPDAFEETEEEFPKTEAEAAAREMKDLVDRLLRTAIDRGGGAYMTLQRESAASRFLIRAKAAMLHPRDARRIRLVDFGRELDE